MLNGNHKSASCEYAEQIVSHLYGEFDSAEKVEFKAHLEKCSFCADELKSFGFVRSSILEWRDERFSKLETPIFDIPAKNRGESFSVVANSNESRSWLGEFRKIFSFNPALAALAVLVVCVGITLFAFNFSGGSSEIAGNGIDKNSTQTSASPKIEVPRKSEEINIADKSIEKSTSPEAADLPREIKREKSVVADKSIVKVSNSVPKNNSAVKIKETNDNIKKTPSVQKQPIPNLTNLEVEEDDSIRLADLFDEIDTK